ncbi:hypothetical protein IWW37_003010 [Coemansia sp. RSA 2050]|nr:hypothetical protein IWW37_003010 [Coemansia sp. RSA 2050]KAJ2733524.1 hypothetical protein IW152_002990 [Coemansia sp. BCRC 34962]
MASSTVRVALRIRPLSPQEHASGETECVTQLPGVPQIVIGADRAFTFDYVFSPEVSQEQVYDDAIAPLVDQFLQGYNATILAYGQTGSGKTFSMGTGLTISVTQPELQGNLEEKSKQHPAFTYSIDVSFLELYNEDLVDLLNPRSPTAGGSGGRGPTIRENSRGNMVLVGVERKLAAGEDDIIGYLHQGALSRTTASTDMNHTSSRSHAIFTIYLTQQDRRSSLMLANVAASGLEPSELDSGLSIVSKIHFVDLAGSERIKRTGAAGDRAKEGISINAGLLALGNVISALGSMTAAPGTTGLGAGGQASRRGTMHVPYRDSKLTRLLQDSLGGNSQTLMLACISPSDRNSPESLNTIRYANRARNIRNKVAVNFDKNSSVELSMLKTEVARLRGELSKLKLQRRQSTLTLNGANTDSNCDANVPASVAMRKNADLTQRLEQALRRVASLENERNALRLRIAELGSANQPTPSIPSSSFPDFAASAVFKPDDSGLHPNGSANDSSRLADAADVMSQSNVLSTMDRELSEQAERHEHQIASVRRHFTSRLELVQESLLVVQKERDVALQRLANANLPAKSELRAGSKAAAAAAASGRGSATTAPNRRALGIDIVPVGTTTPTKLRLPSRAAKSTRHDQSVPSTPLSRMASGGELRSSPNTAKPFAQLTRMGSSSTIGLAACSSQDDHTPHMRRMQDEIDSLKRENKRVLENSSAESERLTLQIQEQAKEISRLRRQHTGRRESDRYSLLSFKENSWGAAKSAAAASSSSLSAAHRHHTQDGDPHANDAGHRDEGSGPNLLRAAYIKAVVENELQRCVRARQLLRERDSFLAEQDQLMNQQNDLLLSMQNLQQDSEMALASDEDDTTGEDEYKSMQMQRVSEKIEIIDAELHHLDLKVRDAEAEVAQLAEAAPATDDASNLNASGLLIAPAIVNMSGLAMRMVEDVVRVDYRAFVDLFQSLPQADSTGLAYLLMQDIIEHQLVALRDARERASLEEQAMDLRRTLLAMQKTALNAALSYERELGDAERKLDQLLPPPSLPFAPAHQLSRQGSAIRTGEHPGDGPDYSCDRPGEGAAAFAPATNLASASDAAVLDRSIYEGVRERGILLRSALISALEAPPLGSEASASSSRLGCADGWDGGASSADNMSMENIRSAKAHVAEWSEDASDFASLCGANNDDYNSASDDASLPYESIYSKISPTDPTIANPLLEVHIEPGSSRVSAVLATADAATLDNLAHINSSSEDTTHMFADASDVFEPSPGSGTAAWSASRLALPPRSRLNMVTSPAESDTSFVSTSRGLVAPATNTQTAAIIDTLPVDSDHGDRHLLNTKVSGSEGEELPELNQSGKDESFWTPNIAHKQSIRNRRYQLTHRASMRKQIANSKLAGPRVGHSGSAGRRKRGSLRKARISLPIVPPEMIEYIDKRHPTAISVGSTPPIIASPETLREMRIVPDSEYQGNISAFASFAMKQNPTAVASSQMSPSLPPRRQSIAKDAIEQPLSDTAVSVALALSPTDSSRTKTSSVSPDMGSHVYTPRSAGKVTSCVDVNRSPSGYSPQAVPAYARLGNPGSPATSMLWSPVAVGGAPSMLESTDNTLLPTAHTTPQQHSPASAQHNRLGSSPDIQHHSRKSTMQDKSELCASPALSSSGAFSPRVASRGDSIAQEQCTSPTRLRREISQALVQPSSGQLIYGDYPGFKRPYSDIPDSSNMTRPSFPASSPRPHSDLVSNTTASDVEKPQRFVSPGVNPNASLFSMLDATHADIGNSNYAGSDIEREDSHDSSLASLAANGNRSDRGRDLTPEKPARIRRRALTANIGGDSPSRRASDRMDKAGGGVSRLSKIFGGFGLGGSKSKPPPSSSFILHGYYRADPNLAGYGGMTSTVDVGRDRSNSDSTEAHVAHVRKVHSSLDRVTTGINYDWPASAIKGGDGSCPVSPTAQPRSDTNRPSTANATRPFFPPYQP